VTDAPSAKRRALRALAARPWLSWGVARAVAFIAGGITALVHRGNVFYDVSFYGTWATRTLDGSAIPYADFSWEYPPAALPAMLPPALITLPLPELRLVPYIVAWVAMVLLIDAAVFRLVLRRSSGGMSHPGVQLWAFALPLLGALSWSRFDIFPAAVAIVAVLLAGSRREAGSGAMAGLGATLKLWPIFLAPIQRTRRAAIRASMAAAAVIVGVAAITFALTGSTGFSQVLGYQSERGLQIESLVALPLMWLYALGGDGYYTLFAFGAWEIHGPGTEALSTIATGTFLLSLAAIGLAHWRLMKVDAGRRGVALTAVALLLVSLVTNKVFSPQYVLWLVAVVTAAAVLDPQTWKPYVRPLLVLAALTHLTFPMFYGDIVEGRWFGLTIMTVRSVLLIGLLVAVIDRMVREVRTVREREAALLAIDDELTDAHAAGASVSR
jgi:hypothetical protein